MTKVEAIKDLRTFYGLRPGSKVYVKIETVSRNGMSRTLSVYLVRRGKTKRDDYIADITGYVAAACGMTLTKDRTIRVGGCGMDMAWQVVYELGMAMYPRGFRCIERRDAEGHITRSCPSNDHCNRCNDKWHKSGGYALVKLDL